MKKFTDRRTAIGRIWKTIQGLAQPIPAAVHEPEATEGASGPAVEADAAAAAPTEVTSTPRPDGPQKAHVAPVKAASRKKTTRPGTSRKPARKTDTVRTGSKAASVLALLKRKGGATLDELMKATNWQPHSVRGFLSGAIGKKMGLTVVSTKTDCGVRRYSING